MNRKVGVSGQHNSITLIKLEVLEYLTKSKKQE